MLAYWPGKTPTQYTESSPLIIEDFFPSILEMTQTKVKKTVQTVDGKSFVPLLKGEGQDRGSLFWHYPNSWGPTGPGIGSYSAIRNGDWKLIYFHENQKIELYHLPSDIGEQKNLANENPDKTLDLAEKLSTHLKEVGAQMPVYKKTQKPVPLPLNILQ